MQFRRREAEYTWSQVGVPGMVFRIRKRERRAALTPMAAVVLVARPYFHLDAAAHGKSKRI